MNQPYHPFRNNSYFHRRNFKFYGKKENVFIGIPKKEKPIPRKTYLLTPDAVNAHYSNDIEFWMEAGAGEGAKFLQIDYTNAGAANFRDTKKVFADSILLKVEPPTLAEMS